MNGIEEFRKETWGLYPKLDVPGLYPPAVLFSVLESDPRPKFRDQLKRIQEKTRGQSGDSGSPPDARLVRQSQLSVAWDSVFHEVPGDRMGLLFQNQPGPAIAKGTSEAGGSVGPAYAVMIKSNAQPGTRWLVTRSTRFKGQLVCWCIPVELETGKTTDVSLSLQNMTVLQSE